VKDTEPARDATPGEKRGRKPFGELAELHDDLAIEAVGRMTGDEGEDRRGQELHQPDHAQLHRPVTAHRSGSPSLGHL